MFHVSVTALNAIVVVYGILCSGMHSVEKEVAIS